MKIEGSHVMATISMIWGEMPLLAGRPTVSVVIPALNEARNLPHVAARMPSDIDEIVFVDGHSVDDTVTVSRRLWPDAVQVTQTRSGKGNALACGFEAASGDIIVMIDADGSTDPLEIPRYVAALVAGADFAKGSRFIPGGGSADITKFRRFGNWGLNAIVNTLFACRYTDLCYGYNAFWRDCLDVMQLPASHLDAPQWGDGFEVETLINVRIAARRMEVAEVCSYEASRIYGTSNLNAVRDGMRVLRTIRREFRSSRRHDERLWSRDNRAPGIPGMRMPASESLSLRDGSGQAS
jgi:glycosyltransferase involved in cell wall biosynthesis